MKYFQPHPLWHLWQQKIKTPSTGALIRARVRTPSANTQPSPHPIKPTNPPPPPSEHNLQKHSPTKKYSSAMKQPTTNQQWNSHRQIMAPPPNQYSFAPLIHLFRKAKVTKQNIDKEKTAQICRFFTHWGYFYPYTNRGGRAIRKSLLEQKTQKRWERKKRSDYFAPNFSSNSRRVGIKSCGT